MSKNIFISFIKTTYSGQSASSEVLIRLLEKNNLKCKTIPLFPFVRGKINLFSAITKFIKEQFITLKAVFPIFIEKKPILIINLGQSIASFFRVGIWYLPFKIIRPNAHVIISLNGSLFINWEKKSFVQRIFLFILGTSNYITVVGNNQREILSQKGVSKNKIITVRNTFDLKHKAIKEKQQLVNDSLNLLHLSLLIESKGFPEYLEALISIINIRPDLKINAILCGPNSFTNYCVRFKNVADKTNWIEAKMNEINKSENVNIKWIKGAVGLEKQKLFDNADIFVFPSQFPVEAQPLVLIEAMASSCAIITSNIGEIPSTVNNECAIILEKINSEIVANEIIKLCDDKTKIVELGANGEKRVLREFSEQVYFENWIKLINNE